MRLRRVANTSAPSCPLDNLTHALVGAAVSKAGAEKTTPLATATLVVAANAPDIDMVGYLHGGYFALSFRRGITHGIPALIVLPFLVAGVMLGWDRWVRRRRNPDAPPARPGAILLLSAIGLLTHPTLDWMNTYGMRWLLPFSDAWTYGDALFIIDPWLWLGLGGAVFLSATRGSGATLAWGALAALASLLILGAPLPLPGGARVVWILGLAAIVGTALAGRPRATAGKQRLAAGALLGCALYILGMVTADLAARGHVRTAAAELGLEVTDLMVSPNPANPFTTEVEVRTHDAFVPGVHRWVGQPRVELFPRDAVPLLEAPDELAPPEVERILAEAERIPDAHYWLEWSRFPYVRVTPSSGGWDVTYADARYDGRAGAGSLSGVRVHVPGSAAPEGSSYSQITP